MNRRNILLSLVTVAAVVNGFTAVAAGQERTFTDAAGRKVALPANITRVMAAGPPASVLLYSVAPEKLVGWVREFKDDEKEFIAEPTAHCRCMDA
ncbi:hypothetical protein [Aminobacter sp. AP02]|uniref:hypothetical protein n=1 Tax=Aminobacter sp. AP02 TaxID=2135737 RepID=UPI000D79F359|nr:hypothetical protein C8K44_12116 [Aminobacter sp. AP02]